MSKPEPTRFRLSQAHLLNLLHRAQSMLNALLNFFSLKTNKQFWGIVYDSVSKQPLDPVIVKLSYVDGREVATCVTDLAGRYGFLARPGKFKIFARKTNYVFPSRYVEGEQDGIYDNLYHGEFFVLFDDSEVVAPNIPMDPENFDWNQQAKQAVSKSRPHGKLFIKRLAAVLFWFGLAFCLVEIWSYQFKPPKSLFWLLLIYLGIIILARIVPHTRLWGRMKIRTRLEGGSRIFLELANPAFPDMRFGNAYVDERGKFLLRANPGKYLLKVSKVNAKQEKKPLGTLKVRISRLGVLNTTISLKGF